MALNRHGQVGTMPRKRKARPNQQAHPKRDQPFVAVRNKPLHIPIDFGTAVEGLLNVKPKKKRSRK